LKHAGEYLLDLWPRPNATTGRGLAGPQYGCLPPARFVRLQECSRDVGLWARSVTLRQSKQGTFGAGMRRRALHNSDLPLRMKVAAEASGRFQYMIVCNDGTVSEASTATFATEAAARAAGGPVLRRRRLAARL